MRIVTYCKDDVIGPTEVPGITRDQLAVVVIVFDFMICLFFIGFIDYALFLIDKEAKTLKDTTVLITDFAVRIGNLPSKDVFGSHTALEAKLANHINKIVNHPEARQ